MISLETVKNKKIVYNRIPKNNIRPIDSLIKIKNKIIPMKWFFERISWIPYKGYLNNIINSLLFLI